MSSAFYTSIAPYYNHIFPFNPEQIEFLRRVIPYNGARILDVGCSTGELVFALTRFGFPTWGIDSDPNMIGLANQSKDEDAMFPVFEQLDMTLLGDHFPENYFDTLICFGNTLVHLQGNEEILKFLEAAHRVLSQDGKLSLQILNYDMICQKQLRELPEISNEHIRFGRSYIFTAGSEYIDFETKLIVKASGQTISNSVKLYAIGKSTLEKLLVESGFGNFQYFGGFNSSPLQSDSLRLIVNCVKM